MLGAGILKAFVGLSGSVFTTVYVGAFKPRMGAFMLFLALGPPALGLLGLALVNHVAPDARPGGKWAGRAFLSAAAGGMPKLTPWKTQAKLLQQAHFVVGDV